MSKLILLRNGAVVVIGVVALVNIGKTLLDLRVKEARYTNLVKEVQNLRDKKIALTKDLAEAQTPWHIEKQARDNLQMIKPGEKLVIIPDERAIVGSALGESTVKVDLPVWKQWVALIFQ